MKKHTTHFDDCGCLTRDYKIAINALFAIQRHLEISTQGNKMALSMSSIYQIANHALDSINSLRKD
jgi:hypothetical protein